MSNVGVFFAALHILNFKSECTLYPDPESQESKNVSHSLIPQSLQDKWSSTWKYVYKKKVNFYSNFANFILYRFRVMSTARKD